MDKMAENGIAAHWLYKSFPNDTKIRTKEWLNNILEIQKNAGSSLEFIEHIKIDLYPDEVYVFTPDGDIMSLPNGSTCVDFAYAVHTDVGHSCIAVKIDKRLVPMSTKLSNGQTVEIITAKGANPNPAWLTFVATGKAHSNIRHWLKNQHTNESIQLGKRLLDRAISELLPTPLEPMKDSEYNEVLKELNIASKEELFAQIGLGNQLAPLVARKLLVKSPTTVGTSLPLTIKGTEGMVINYAKCCHPIPGDTIIGFFNVGRGIIIHQESCNKISEMQHSPEKYVFTTWADNITGKFPVELKIETLSNRSILATVAKVLSDCDANIEDIHVDDNQDDTHSVLLFTIHVTNRTHLAIIIKKLRSINTVTNVLRLTQGINTPKGTNFNGK